MPRETQKQIIERLTKEIESLKKELQEWKVISNDKDREISELINNKDDVFKGSCDYEQMKKRIAYLELKNKSLEEAIGHNKRLHEFVKGSKVHNERGAGRKSKLSDLEKESIRMYRIQGKTIKDIAEMFSCSSSLIHKLISE